MKIKFDKAEFELGVYSFEFKKRNSFKTNHNLTGSFSPGAINAEADEIILRGRCERESDRLKKAAKKFGSKAAPGELELEGRVFFRAVPYSFEIVENSRRGICEWQMTFLSFLPRKTAPRPEYYTAKEGQTVFDIALETKEAAEEIILKNNLFSPFEISGGGRIKL